MARYDALKDCITHCWNCRTECQRTLFEHCLTEGGEHVAADHVRLMADCIQICQTAADFMTRGSDAHVTICRACADVCDACAESCAAIDSEQMQQCAQTCRECAQACRDMVENASGDINL